jgi:hypothetical protein
MANFTGALPQDEPEFQKDITLPKVQGQAKQGQA